MPEKTAQEILEVQFQESFGGDWKVLGHVFVCENEKEYADDFRNEKNKAIGVTEAKDKAIAMIRERRAGLPGCSYRIKNSAGKILP